MKTKDEFIGDKEPDCPEDFKKIEEQKLQEIKTKILELTKDFPHFLVIMIDERTPIGKIFKSLIR